MTREKILVLLVEDEEPHIELIRRAFAAQAERMSLITASGVREARARIEEALPDLVIADLVLPDGQGTELVPESARYPVVVMTSHGDERVAVEAMKAGALHYVVKSALALADLPRVAERTLREWSYIVERQRAEAALQRSERRYRALYDDNPSMFFTVDAAGTVRSVNRFAAEQLGYEVGELVGKPLTRFHPAADRSAVERHLEQCFHKPEILHRWEICQERRDASRLWVRVTARIVNDVDGHLSALIVCEDVTEAAADSACYAAKDQGRNRVHLYHEDDADLARRQGEMQWVSRIHSALEKNNFYLTYQPIAPIQSPNGGGTHYELLLRMVDDNQKLIMPGAFLPAAERYDLTDELDHWVAGTAFRWLAAHRDHLESLHLCSINLSGHSLGNRQFLEFITTELKERAIPAEKICFEITETAAISNLPSATRFIKDLRELGCRFALDDFGSGLSSFAYLKNLPVDFLKIDGLFVKDIVDDPIDLAVVKSINEIGHVMGKRTIAEFVESEAILDKLRDIGIDYAQGYHIGHPQPITEMAS